MSRHTFLFLIYRFPRFARVIKYAQFSPRFARTFLTHDFKIVSKSLRFAAPYGFLVVLCSQSNYPFIRWSILKFDKNHFYSSSRGCSVGWVKSRKLRGPTNVMGISVLHFTPGLSQFHGSHLLAE